MKLIKEYILIGSEIMEKENIKKIIEIRSYLIGLYESLDAKLEPHGVIKQSDVAYEVSRAIKKIDNLLKDKVQFR